MHHSRSSNQNQRTNPHLEALPSNRGDLPASYPETVRKKACTEDTKKLRVRPRRPDMQLYVPRARRSQAAPGTSTPLDAHSTESVQNSQIDNKSSVIPFEVTQSCSRLVPNMRQSESEKRNHLFESSIENQEYGSETENLSENDNSNFKRNCNQVNDIELSSTQLSKKCSSETILYNKNSVENKNNILNAQVDCEKVIINQNSSILSKEFHVANLPEVPDVNLIELTNQKEESYTPEDSLSALLVNECKAESNVCSPSISFDTAFVEGKLDSSAGLHQEKEHFPKENNVQPELIEIKGLNDESEHLSTDTSVANCEKPESSTAEKESTLNSKEPYRQMDKIVMQQKVCVSVSEMQNAEGCEGKNTKMKSENISNDCVSESEMQNIEEYEEKNVGMKPEDVSNDSVLKTRPNMDTPSQSTEELTALNSNDVVDKSNSTNDDSWDSLFDDNGECLNPEVLKELTTTVGNVKITKSKYNYFEFQPHEPDVSGDEFGHIVEFYDFPVEFKNQDLLTIFSAFKNEAFNIKWVDDTHALGVFSSPSAAMDALSLNHPLLKVRPLSQGIRESKFKAKRCAEFLQPYKPRPATSASLARRLVSGALGVKVQIPKEQRELERKRLQEAKDRRRQAAKQKQDIWDGIVS